MAFEFKKCIGENGLEYDGLYEVFPRVFGDHRGYFFEAYSEKDFFAAGLDMKFVQDNQSFSSQGVLRGLHFQKQYPQGKLIRAISGRVLDVVLDLRKGSASFGKYFSVILDGEKQNQLYIPKGFAHGFEVLSETAVIGYKCTDFYHPEDEGGILWNDKIVNVSWMPLTVPFLLSEKDKKLPSFDNSKDYFDINGNWIGN